ncbi:MAG: DNA repair protein RecN [Erysipelotrichaceae bacterium]|nr:DNA repair protein RecN [Erysipelotrichaceae bacterium]
MLKYLYIKDFIIFDEVSIDLENGFNVFTGETGAGKSIMVDAIGLLCANRANGSLVAKNKESAIIEGVFDFNNSEPIINLLKEYDLLNDEETIITRIIKSDGKSIARINHRNVNLNIIKEIMEYSIDIHSQHDTQYLLKQSNHINLLDNFNKNNVLISEVKNAYEKYISIKKEIDITLSQTYNVDDVDFIQFEIDEINDANLSIEEENELIEKEKNYKLLSKNISKINDSINLFDKNVQSSFYEIIRNLNDLDNSELSKQIDFLNNSYYEIENTFDYIKNYVNKFDFSVEDINYIQERLYIINKLKRKYGANIENIFNYRDSLIKKLEIINNRQDYLNKMEISLNKARNEFLDCSLKLSDYRKKVASELDKKIIKILKDLMLPNVKFKTEIIKGNETALGIDNVTFLVSMNAGEDLKPISDVASGGELSRLMLGLKSIFSDIQGIQTIIFDEIDTGVSGPVATSIGQKMKQLSKNIQVISITHLSQVAACGDNHYHVYKEVHDNKTNTIIKKLNYDERLKELALISSGEVTKSSLIAAKELFEKNQGI